MEYGEFKRALQEQLQERFGARAHVEIQTFLKNNSKRQDGIMVFQEGSSATPAVYLDKYYDEFQSGASLGAIVREISDFYEDNHEAEFDLSFFKEFAKVRERIVFQLVNFERNAELFQEVPYVRTLDLAMVFLCRVEHPSYGNVNIMIRDTHLKLWGTDVVALYERAMANTPRLLPCELKSMGELLSEIGQDDLADISNELIISEENDPGMYVLSNYLHCHGAACMMYRGILSKFAMACGSDFYIIPSSVHEVILIPVKKMLSHSAMNEVVGQVNRTQVASEEVLADTVYFYSRKLKKILF